jgi:hypothetical protein
VGAEPRAATRQRLIAAAWRAGVRNVAELSRSVQVREHLARVIAATPLRGPSEEADDRDAVYRQINQVAILKLLYGPDEVADAYTSWLDTSLSEQVKTATPRAVLTGQFDCDSDVVAEQLRGRTQLHHGGVGGEAALRVEVVLGGQAGGTDHGQVRALLGRGPGCPSRCSR